ncbi:hypothetical protein OHA84_37935 (plasmid) [Streptomyces sp. NBC_00513]|nr:MULTISPECIES: hypothetical protein [unclassified Streptomyces]MCX5078767.1 hypothetical protein [Streptomyces sp. NBC_00424]WUD46311.1 hypothetical protein OHA84_37935 [Streptomyces sp. NBC_00513]
MLTVELEDQGRHESAERIGDVIAYACRVGERTPVNGWTSKV